MVGLLLGLTSGGTVLKWAGLWNCFRERDGGEIVLECEEGGTIFGLDTWSGLNRHFL